MDADIRQMINEKMKSENLSAADIARDLGVSHQAVSQVIGGDRGKIPQSLVDVLTRLNLTLKAVDIDA